MTVVLRWIWFTRS